MSFKDKVVNLYLRGKDLFTPESNKVSQALSKLKDESADLRTEFTKLKAAEKEIAKADQLQQYAAKAEQALNDARQELSKTTKEYDDLTLSSRESGAAVKNAAAEAAKAEKNYQSLTDKLRAQNTLLDAAGVDTKDLASANQKLQQSIAGVTADLDKLEAAEKAIARQAELEAHLNEVAKGLKEAKAEVTKYAQAIDGSKKASKEQRTELKLAESAVRRLSTDYEKTSATLAELKGNIESAGISNRSLASSQSELADKTKALKVELANLQALQKNTAAANSYNAEIETAKQRMIEAAAAAEKLKTAYRDTDTDIANAANNLKRASAEAGKAEANYTKLSSQLAQVKASLQNAGVETDDLTNANKKLVSELNRVETEIKNNRSQVKALGGQYAALKEKALDVASGTKSLVTELLAFGTAYLGIREVGNALANLLNTGGGFEDFRAQLKAVYDDGAKGDAAFAWIKAFSRETPNSIAQVTDAFLILKNNGMDPMDGTLRKLIAANTKYGRGQETLIPIIRQMSQAWAKGQLTAEDANTTIENGVPVWELLSKAMGRSVGELRKMSEAGLLTRPAIAALFNEMERSSIDTMAERMTTWNSQLVKFKDLFTEFKALIADSGVLDYFKDQLVGINTEMKAMAEDGRLKAIAAEWAGWIVTTAKSTKEFVTGLVADFDALALRTSQTMGVVQVGFNVFTIAIKGFAVALLSVFESIAKGAANVAEAFGTEEMAKRARDGANAITAINDAFKKETLQDAQDIKDGWEKLTGEAYEATKANYQGMSGAADEAGIAQKKLIDEMVKAAGDISDKLDLQGEAFKALGVKSATVLQNLANDAKNAYETIKSGEAPLAQQQKAFLAWAKASIQAATAAGTYVDNQVAIEAQNLNVVKSFKELEEKYGEVATSAKTASQTEKEAANSRIEQLKQQADASRAYYLSVQEGYKSGKVSAEELDIASQQLVTSTIALSDAQKIVGTSTAAMGEGIQAAAKDSVAFLQAQKEAYDAVAVAAKKAFDDGTGSAEDYLAAVRDLTLANERLQKAQKKQSEETAGQTQQVKAFEAAMKAANITTVAAMKEQEQTAKKAYIASKENAAIGVASANDVKEAFLKWAESSIQVAAATGKQVDASILAQAANLNLSGSVEDLIKRYMRLKDVQNNLGKESENTADKVDKSATEIGTTMQNGMGIVVKSAEQAGESLGGVAQFFTDFLKGVQAQVAALSTGAVDYFKSILYGQTLLTDGRSELEKTRETYQKLSSTISDLQNTLAKSIDFTGISSYARKAEIIGKQTEKAYYGQQIRMLELVEALEKGDNANLKIINSAERAAKGFNLLNDQDISKLTSAIEKAKSRMDGLRDSVQDTLSTLQDELDQYQGKQDQIEARRYAEDKAKLKAQLAEAQSTGDKQLIEQIKDAQRTLEEVYKYRLAEVKASQAEQQQTNQTQTVNQNTSTNTASSKTTTVTESLPTPSLSTSGEVATLRLVYGPMTIDALVKKQLLAEFMAQVERQKSLGN